MPTPWHDALVIYLLKKHSFFIEATPEGPEQDLADPVLYISKSEPLHWTHRHCIVKIMVMWVGHVLGCGDLLCMHGQCKMR